MANAPLDFRFRKQLNVAGIASLLANKNVKEEQIRSSRDRSQQDRFSFLLNAVNLGSNLATSALNRSMVKQTQVAQAGLADALGSLTSVQQRSDQPALQQPIQQFSSAGEPTGQVQPTLGETTAPQAALAEVRKQASLVSPGSAAQSVFQDQADPLGEDIQRANLAKIKAQTAKAQRPEKIAAGEQLLSVFATRKVLKDAGFKPKEIKAGVSKDGITLPKRMKKRDADALKGKAGFSFNFGSAAPLPEELGLKGKSPTGSNVADKFGF